MVQCRVPAVASELHEVRRCAEGAAAGFGLGNAERYEFVFAVNEAVTNAIRHGQPFADGTIGLRIEADGDTIICSVSDGGYFESQPTNGDIWAEGGRGLAAMARMMDQIEFSSSSTGTTVRLHKRRSGAAESED
jgi:anti-sigma regulatory factor (Ser/Thr protein kinase)